ncbi:MAG TPA: cyanophycinase [Bacteroidia bacterium]|nr:cyanophycinase [Bacteroidia bacterium]
MIPKGKLLIIGGAEDKGPNGHPAIKHKTKEFRHFEILGELLPPDKHKPHRIEVITTASSVPLELSEVYMKCYAYAGFKDVHHLSIEDKDQARDPEIIDRITKANVVLFTGGDQFRLATILGGTDFIELLIQRYKEDSEFIIAGTSAGAMVMSRLMLYQGDNNEAMLKGEIKIASGFGIIDNCIIDTHFVKRGRFGRLAQAIVMNPTFAGIGLGEDTALIIHQGNRAECRGSGMVIIIDGKEIGYTNIPEAEDGMPLCVENLKVHVLCRGNGFLLKERQFLPNKKELRKQHHNHAG